MCENSRINWAGIQESLQTKLDRFLLTHKATPTALGTSPRELQMNRQSRLRLNVLRAKSLKQYYVKQKCKGKSQNSFGPTSPLKQSQLYSSKCHIKQSGFTTDKDKVESFNRFFFSTSSKADVIWTSLSTSQTSDSTLSNSIKFSIDEASSVLEKVNPHKEPWPDKLPSSIWKECADELQSQSKLLRYISVFSPSQWWCTKLVS